jgi:catechol 2,3-dioxygenase-like lactoylglutathione lyase family enzyme
VLRLRELRQHQRLLVDFGVRTTDHGPGVRPRPAAFPGGAARVGDNTAKLMGLHHVQLAMPKGEEEAAVRFYGAILGLPQVEKPPELAPRGGVWFRDGDLEVHLGVEEPEFMPARKAHPAFLVRNLSTLRERIETAGYRVTDDVPLEGYHRCHVRDPFGNRLELVEPIEP